MKRIFSIISALFIICSANCAFADNMADGEAELKDKDRPSPVIIDENFDIEMQDFLNDNNVSKVKILNGEANDKEILFTRGTPYLDGDSRIRVPLRDFAEQLGYNVHWYSETGQIVISNNDNWFTLTPQDNIVVCKPHFAGVDKEDNTIIATHFVMDCVPQIIDDITYIPLRHISNILYYHVDWNKDNLTATLYNTAAISYGSGVLYYDIDPPVKIQ